MMGKEINQMIKNADFQVVTLSPAVGKRLADKCGVLYDKEFEEKIVEMLYQSGVDCILNLANTSEYSLIREADLFLKHMRKKSDSPYYSVFCPAGKKFAKKNQFKNISNVRSPAAIQDALVREKYNDKGQVLHVIIVPCIEKCIEIEEMVTDSKMTVPITVEVFYRFIRKNSLDFAKFKTRKFDHIIPELDFRPEYGTADRILQYAGFEVQWEDDKELQGDFQRGYFTVDGKEEKVLVAKGKIAIQKLLLQIETEKYSFVEILGCSNGCCGEKKK